jgi:hypothetical protein
MVPPAAIILDAYAACCWPVRPQADMDAYGTVLQGAAVGVGSGAACGGAVGGCRRIYS